PEPLAQPLEGLLLLVWREALEPLPHLLRDAGVIDVDVLGRAGLVLGRGLAVQALGARALLHLFALRVPFLPERGLLGVAEDREDLGVGVGGLRRAFHQFAQLDLGLLGPLGVDGLVGHLVGLGVVLALGLLPEFGGLVAHAAPPEERHRLPAVLRAEL